MKLIVNVKTYLREKAAAKSKALQTIENDEVVVSLESIEETLQKIQRAGWIYVEYGDQKGYVSSKVLRVAETAFIPQSKKGQWVHVRYSDRFASQLPMYQQQEQRVVLALTNTLCPSGALLDGFAWKAYTSQFLMAVLPIVKQFAGRISAYQIWEYTESDLAVPFGLFLAQVIPVIRTHDPAAKILLGVYQPELSITSYLSRARGMLGQKAKIDGIIVQKTTLDTASNLSAQLGPIWVMNADFADNDTISAIEIAS